MTYMDGSKATMTSKHGADRGDIRYSLGGPDVIDEFTVDAILMKSRRTAKEANRIIADEVQHFLDGICDKCASLMAEAESRKS